jgi:hypothetical protein
MGFERNKKIIIKILIAVIVVLLTFAGYIVVTNNSKFKVKAAIKYVFNQTDYAFKLAENSVMTNAFLENKVEITNRLTAKVSLSDDTIESIGPASKKIENLINDSIIETNIKSDIINKYMDMGINYSYNNEKITANGYINNSELYIYVKDYFSKYLKVDADDFDAEQFFDQITSGVKVDEIRYLMNILKQSIVDGIDYSKVTNSKVVIDVDEEKLSVNKTTLTIDTDLKNKVTTIFLNKIIHDNKAKEILLKLSDSTIYPNVSYLEDDIRDELLSLESTTYDNEVLGEYSLYTTGLFNTVVRNEIKSLGSEESVIQVTSYKTLTFDTQVAVYKNNELAAQTNIKENTEDNYDIAVTFGQDVSLDVKGTISQKLTDVSYTLRISGVDDVKGDIRLETKNISKNEISQTFNAKLNTPESYGTVNLTVDSTIKIIDNITKPDFKNSVKLDSLTSSQTNSIMTNFQNKNPLIIKTVTEIFNSLMGM